LHGPLAKGSGSRIELELGPIDMPLGRATDHVVVLARTDEAIEIVEAPAVLDGFPRVLQALGPSNASEPPLGLPARIFVDSEYLGKGGDVSNRSAHLTFAGDRTVEYARRVSHHDSAVVWDVCRGVWGLDGTTVLLCVGGGERSTRIGDGPETRQPVEPRPCAVVRLTLEGTTLGFPPDAPEPFPAGGRLRCYPK